MDSHVRKSSSSQASKYSSSVAETNTRFLDDYFSHRDDFDDEFDSKGITKRKSRNLSEKKRRDQFNVLVNELCTMVCTGKRKLDKSTVLKSAISFIRNQNHVAMQSQSQEIQEDWKPSFLSNEEFTHLMLEALDGFIIVFSASGKIMYVSENITCLLGHVPSDLVGKMIYDLIWDEEQEDIRSLLNSWAGNKTNMDSGKENHISLRCHLRRGMSREHSTENQVHYELVHFSGYYRIQGNPAASQVSSWGNSCDSKGSSSYGDALSQYSGLVFVASARLQSPQLIVEMLLVDASKNEFTSRHSLEMKFLFLDHRGPPIIGYLPFEVLGTLGYDYYHIDDLDKVSTCHEALIQKGEGASCCYRFLTKGQQWIWLQTKYHITYHQWNSKPEFIVCSHRVVSAAVPERSENQVQNLLPPPAAPKSETRTRSRQPSGSSRDVATVEMSDTASRSSSSSFQSAASQHSRQSDQSMCSIHSQQSQQSQQSAKSMRSTTQSCSSTVQSNTSGSGQAHSKRHSSVHQQQHQQHQQQHTYPSVGGKQIRNGKQIKTSKQMPNDPPTSSTGGHRSGGDVETYVSTSTIATSMNEGHRFLQPTVSSGVGMSRNSGGGGGGGGSGVGGGVGGGPLPTVTSTNSQFPTTTGTITYQSVLPIGVDGAYQQGVTLPIQRIIEGLPVVTLPGIVAHELIMMTAAQKQLHEQLRLKHAQLQRQILSQQEELARVSEQLLLAQYGAWGPTVLKMTVPYSDNDDGAKNNQPGAAHAVLSDGGLVTCLTTTDAASVSLAAAHAANQNSNSSQLTNSSAVTFSPGTPILVHGSEIHAQNSASESISMTTDPSQVVIRTALQQDALVQLSQQDIQMLLAQSLLQDNPSLSVEYLTQ